MTWAYRPQASAPRARIWCQVRIVRALRCLLGHGGGDAVGEPVGVVTLDQDVFSGFSTPSGPCARGRHRAPPLSQSAEGKTFGGFAGCDPLSAPGDVVNRCCAF
jgi:hypothetical protein